MLTPHFVMLAPIFYSMATFRMLFADILYYVGCSDSLGISPCEVASPNSGQECSRPLFLPSFSCRTDIQAFCSAASSGLRSPLTVLAHTVIDRDFSGIFSFDPLHFAVMTQILCSMTAFRMLFAGVYHYVSCSLLTFTIMSVFKMLGAYPVSAAAQIMVAT
jgi:hypothetical protein